MSKKSRLTISEKLKIVDELDAPDPPSKSCIARKYGVSVTAICKIWSNRTMFRQQSATLPERFKNQKNKIISRRFALLF